MAELELVGVSKNFGKTAIINDLNLAAKAGEFIVLVGPSGCGKSTILRMIAGLEQLSGGQIKLGGQVVNDLSPKQRGVAMVFQNYALYPHMTVRDNIAFSLKLSGMTKDEIRKRVEDSAETLGILAHLHKKPGQLSGGQKQRVAMGRAMVRQPKLFLFDEPLSNLDAQLRVKMRAEIAQLHERLGSTVVYVTHDQVEAMTLADRIAVLNKGKIEQFGAPLEVYNKPQTKFVASFIGTPAMNFVPIEHLPKELVGGRAKVAGVRPEDVFIGPSQTNDAASDFINLGTCRVRLVEPLGSTAHLHLVLGEKVTLVAEIRTVDLPARQATVDVKVPAKRLFFFDDKGKCIQHGEVSTT